jgi:hypothetical protein
MLASLSRTLIALGFSLAVTTAFAQPYDLLVPGTDSPDGLSHELRQLQAIERDMAIEKMTREPSRLDAYIELAELRRSQGKLQEAQRFYEMALEIDPKNMNANQGLAMVHYHKGEFNLARERIDTIHKTYPISDQMKEELEIFRQNLRNEVQIGVTVREDDRGLAETISSLEGIFPSTHYPKLTGHYRFENWNHSDNGTEISTQVYTGTFSYKADKNTSFSVSYGPEIFPGGESIGCYQLQTITGTDNLKIAVRAGKNVFKENISTVQNRLYEENAGISLFGDLHQRTRVIQSIMTTDISDNNARQRYDSEIVHSVFHKHEPLITTSLRFYQFSYEKQFAADGSALSYWSPSDFKGAELALAWERRVGAHWWWGVDSSFISSTYRFADVKSVKDSGAGAAVKLGYQFDAGNLFFSIGDRFHDYFRERKLEIYGSISF